MTQSRQPSIFRWGWLLKIAIAVIVIMALWQRFQESQSQLRTAEFDWQQVEWGWLAVAVALFFIAQLPMATFWHRLLRSVDIEVSWIVAMRAFFVGHLGKYVPGKVVVVVIRSGLLGIGAEKIPSAVSTVFIETLTYMAVGSVLAVVGIGYLLPGQWIILPAILAVCLLAAVATPAFWRRVLATVNRMGWIKDRNHLAALNRQSVGLGWIAALLSWTFATFSLMATYEALAPTDASTWTLATMIRWGTSLAAAVIAGFLSMLPGGLGTREWVLDRLLTPHVGEVYAIVTVVLFRCVCLVTEVLGSTILYLGSIVFPAKDIDSSGEQHLAGE